LRSSSDAARKLSLARTAVARTPAAAARSCAEHASAGRVNSAAEESKIRRCSHLHRLSRSSRSKICIELKFFIFLIILPFFPPA
jgi:hypothetical protein